MQKYSLRRSAIDPDFLEIVLEGIAIQEIAVPFKIRYFPPSFDTEEEVRLWLAQMEEKLLKSSAYRLLARRSYSKTMLQQKLKEKRFSSSQIEKIVDEFEKLGYLSDADYAEMLIQQKMRQGYGPLHIERVFRDQGLDVCIVRKRMNQQMQKEAIKKWLVKLRGKDKSKQIAFLLRRGFDYSVIQ